MIRYPNISGKTDAQKLEQMKSYLHQLVDELNYQLDNGSTGSSSSSASGANKAAIANPTKQDDAISNFNDIKALIIKSADIVNAYSEEINKKLEGQYVAESDFGTFVELTEAQLSASSQKIESVMTKQEYIERDMETLERTTTSEIEQLADSIKLEVKGGEPGNTASIKLTVGDDVYSGTIDMTGLVTFSNNEGKGYTQVDGGNIVTKKIVSADGESVVIDLDNGRAALSGSLTATSGQTKAVLSAGNLSMYYNAVLYGFLSSINWGRDADDPKGVTLSMTDDAQFFSIGYGDEESGYHGKYVINMGLNPDGNTERHQFYEDARFHNGIKGTSAEFSEKVSGASAEFSGKLAADWISCDEIAMTDSKNAEAYYVRLSDDELWLGDVNHKTYLFGSSVEVRDLIDPTLDHHAVPKRYLESYVAKKASNQNLLDNWYFPNAVNQRGAETYRSEGFTVDRWKLGLWQSSGAYVYPNSSDLTLHNETATGTACSCYIEQTLENPSHLAGKTVTLSAKLRNTTTVAGDPILRIYTNKGTFRGNYIRTADAGKIITLTATLPVDITTLTVGIGAYSNNGGDGNFNLAIESMKLELGSVSTLANDAPPKKSEQLLECQRYFIRFASDGGQWLMGASNGTTLYAPLHLPVPLRAFPVLEGENKGFKYANVNIYPYVSGGKVEITSLTLAGASGTQDFMLYANHASNALAAKQPGAIRFTTGGYVELSAEI